MTNKDIDKSIDVLTRLIDIYSRELYEMYRDNNRDWKKQYQLQLKVDRTYQVIDELRKIKF